MAIMCVVHDQLRLILPAGTAIGVRLRHANREVRKLRNVGNHDGGTPSAYTLCTLFSFLKSTRSKGRVRRVPAAAVIPAARVVLIIIESKTSVAGRIDSWVNRTAQRFEFRGDRPTWDRERREVLLG